MLSVRNVDTDGKQNKEDIFVALGARDTLGVLKNEQIICNFTNWNIYD